MGLNMDDGRIIDQLTDMAASLSGINSTLKSMEKRIDSIDLRVQKLEEKPNQYWGYIISAIIVAVVGIIFKVL